MGQKGCAYVRTVVNKAACPESPFVVQTAGPSRKLQVTKRSGVVAKTRLAGVSSSAEQTSKGLQPGNHLRKPSGRTGKQPGIGRSGKASSVAQAVSMQRMSVRKDEAELQKSMFTQSSEKAESETVTDCASVKIEADGLKTEPPLCVGVEQSKPFLLLSKG